MVAQNAVDHLEHEIIGIHIVGLHHIIVVVAQHFGSVVVLVGFDEVQITFGAAVLCGRGHDSQGSVVDLALGLACGEKTQEEECLAGA